MICYNIVNPSDPATFLAPDQQIAVAVLALVGQGAYAGRPLAHGADSISAGVAEHLAVPLFLSVTRPTYEEWWRASGYTSEPIEAALRDRRGEVVAALRSCAYGDLEDRRSYESACEAITDAAKLEKFKRDWEDRRRSSMNRIVQRAWTIADVIEKQEAA